MHGKQRNEKKVQIKIITIRSTSSKLKKYYSNFSFQKTANEIENTFYINKKLQFYIP